MPEPTPAFDRTGLHVLDPHDRLGRKSEYITLLQAEALRRYLPRGQGEAALDLGCGYGRLTSVVGNLGWRVVGVDPDGALLRYAQREFPGLYCRGALPHLPFAAASVGMVVMHNVLRSLHLRERLDAVRGIGAYLRPGGWLVVVDNIRDGHPAYVPERDLVELFRAEGCELRGRIPIRAARWGGIYLIRYGLVPRAWLARIASWELERRRSHRRRPRWQYLNVMFPFQKAG